jgi:hypothetical protein
MNTQATAADQAAHANGLKTAVAGGHAARDWHDKRWYRKAAHHA